ncbi:5'-nucleotidase, lipoprotein e(P4) family [Fulvivirga lutea]|uniref:5'-nucleotidase, lipoprotein e(P4) family n=1 Tax=Fulvivirga lutea TaxID=2810512 RepID=A0A974WJM7_9BACT|nr:5'-nucleotidase, lipoprotein e(P4) family [Fulvivirga lutea]QSE97385.1 5'-nucleotidase, lipoprotein e(P4) family [Fulvivirga lutea]
MKKQILFTLLIAVSFSCFGQSKTSEKAQMSDQLTMSVLWYQQSAEMRQAYYQAYNYAKMLVDNKLETIKTKRPTAVILDIDETVLDNSPYEVLLIDSGWTYNNKTWKQWTDQARAEALPGALDFVKYAKDKGVEVFYISNRNVDELEATVENLKAIGFPNAEEKFIQLKEETSDKTERRKNVTDRYEVLVYVGDNLTDYSEAFGDREADMGKKLVDEKRHELLNNFVMLPNPMYGEWEKAIYDNDYSKSDSMKLELRKEKLIR